MAGFAADSPLATTFATSTAKGSRFKFKVQIYSIGKKKSTNRIMAFVAEKAVAHGSSILLVSVLDQFDSIMSTPTWVQQDNISTYELNTPNRTVQGNYSITENNLASPAPKRHTLGLVGGNEVSRLAGNPQDIESDLRGLTRPLTKCNEREYQALVQGQTSIDYKNRKTDLNIDIRPVHMKDYQSFAYPASYAPQALRQKTCGSPHKY